VRAIARRSGADFPADDLDFVVEQTRRRLTSRPATRRTGDRPGRPGTERRMRVGADDESHPHRPRSPDTSATDPSDDTAALEDFGVEPEPRTKMLLRQAHDHIGDAHAVAV
jgi:hypothetical protein